MTDSNKKVIADAAEWLAKDDATAWGDHEWRLFNTIEAAEALADECDTLRDQLYGRVMVKPLEWFDLGETWKCEAYSICGEIYLNALGTWTLDDGESYSAHETLGLAKEAGDKENKRRILEAITFTLQPNPEDIIWVTLEKVREHQAAIVTEVTGTPYSTGAANFLKAIDEMLDNPEVIAEIIKTAMKEQRNYDAI